MLNEKDIQQALDRRLSGLAASDARRMRIRAAANAQRREEQPVKKKMTLAIALAIAVTMMASVAVAAGLGLFGQLAGSSPDIDRRLTTLDATSTYINQTFELTEDTYPPVTLTIHQAYYDGTRVFISYTMAGPMSKIRTYTGKPENAEWDSTYEDTLLSDIMSSDDPEQEAMLHYLDGSEPRWGRAAHITVHDGLQLEDGTYLEIIGGDHVLLEDGSIAGWKECVVPDEVTADELTVQIGSYQSDTIYYQEGRTGYIDYRTNSRETTTWHSFLVKKDAKNSLSMTGSVDAGEWSAVANMTLSAVDIRGEVTVKVPQSWIDCWWNGPTDGNTPNMIDDWLVYVNGTPVEGYNLQGGNGPGAEGELVFYVCYQHVDPTAEIMLVPSYWTGGAKPEQGIVLQVAK